MSLKLGGRLTIGTGVNEFTFRMEENKMTIAKQDQDLLELEAIDDDGIQIPPITPAYVIPSYTYTDAGVTWVANLDSPLTVTSGSDVSESDMTTFYNLEYKVNELVDNGYIQFTVA